MLDSIDLAGALALIEEGGEIHGDIINCSVDVYSHNGWSMDYQVHQAAVARDRGRPLENKWIGMRLTDPPVDIAGLSPRTRRGGGNGYDHWRA